MPAPGIILFSTRYSGFYHLVNASTEGFGSICPVLGTEDARCSFRSSKLGK